MSIRNYIKKLGKRKAGCWGRINHKRDMRAESKAIRKLNLYDSIWENGIIIEKEPNYDSIWENEIINEIIIEQQPKKGERG